MEPSEIEMTRAAFASTEPLWEGLARRLEHVTVAGATANRLGSLTARSWRSAGRPVPPDLLRQERAARMAETFAPALLAQVASAYDGPMVVFKGPEIAARYPDAGRNFSDVDLLVPDAKAVQRALLAAGFVEVEDPEGAFSEIHHLTPLRWPTLPLHVEIHSALKWPRSLDPPDLAEIFAQAVPAAVAPDALRAPAPHHHALILAAHSWAHTPLRSARDLVDVAAIADEADAAKLDAATEAWGLSRVWPTVRAAADWLMSGTRRPLAVSLWARHLIDLREATVLEGHLERWLSPFWALPPLAAFSTGASMLANDLWVQEDETVRQKLSRAARAARHALTPKSSYGWTIDETPVVKKRSRKPR